MQTPSAFGSPQNIHKPFASRPDIGEGWPQAVLLFA
jgi:hypothetical protein